MEEHDKNQEFSFIKEKIKEKPINKRRLFYKILWVVFGGCLFGLMACLTFVVAKPKLEVLVKPRPDTTVTFPKDQETGEEETGIREPEHGGNQENGGQGIQEPAGNQEAGESGNQEPEESVPEVQVPVYVEREFGTEDYQALQNKLYDIGKRRNRSVVTVTGVTSNTDWFASAYESESQASGIIIANNGQELLILTEKRSLPMQKPLTLPL